ncbi:MAG: hypothetical protein AAF889_05555 [Cyanobacteria bacterium P01_D01_bin.73]
MESWSRKIFFLDRDIRFIGPLESAASLGLMKAFRIYRAAPENANFLELQHHGVWNSKIFIADMDHIIFPAREADDDDI